MKPVRPVLAAILSTLALAACAPSPEDRIEARADNGGWLRPPVVSGVARAGDSLVLTGLAEPGGRVVLRGNAGAAFATSADARGRFEVRLPAPTEHLWLRPELQAGRTASAAPDRLLLIAGGPAVVLRPGGAARRLGPAPALSAIDSDGRILTVSGRADRTGRPVTVSAGGPPVDVPLGAGGAWSVVLPSQGAGPVTVDGAVFDWPGEGGAGAAPVIERAGAGWRIDWTGAGEARQSTWLPDAG